MTIDRGFTATMQAELAKRADVQLVVTGDGPPRITDVAEIMVQNNVQSLAAACRLLMYREPQRVWGTNIGYDLYDPAGVR
jgi:hypothetical protein